jgi:hypothetical protein
MLGSTRKCSKSQAGGFAPHSVLLFAPNPRLLSHACSSFFQEALWLPIEPQLRTPAARQIPSPAYLLFTRREQRFWAHLQSPIKSRALHLYSADWKESWPKPEANFKPFAWSSGWGVVCAHQGMPGRWYTHGVVTPTGADMDTAPNWNPWLFSSLSVLFYCEPEQGLMQDQASAPRVLRNRQCTVGDCTTAVDH